MATDYVVVIASLCNQDSSGVMSRVVAHHVVPLVERASGGFKGRAFPVSNSCSLSIILRTKSTVLILPVLSASVTYSEDLRNIPKVFSIKLLVEVIVKLGKFGIILRSYGDVINIY